MLRIGEHSFGRTDLNNLALLHHTNIVCHVADNAKIMGDQQKRHAEFFLQIFEQFQNLRLHGDVQRRGWLIGN